MKNKPHSRQLKCLLIEDEQRDINIISQYIENHDRLQYVGTTIDITEFSKIIRSNKIDIIFLDNELGKAPHQRNQGLEFLDTLINLTHPNPIPYIISISQYPEDYQKALELNVWSVISKPIEEENFKIKVGRVIEVIDDKDEIKRLKEGTKKSNLMPFGRIAIKEKGTNQKHRFIELSNIVYIESIPSTHEVIIYLSEPHGDSILTTNANFATLEGFLAGRINDNRQLTSKQTQFFGRIKKSCIVNLCYIDAIEGNVINLKGIDKPLSIINSEYREGIRSKQREVLSS